MKAMLFLPLVAAPFLALHRGETSHCAPPAGSPAASPLDRFKALAGDWVEVDADGNPTERVVTRYRVSAAGSAVLETVFPGEEHEMLTVYHMDGDDLVLTHYCMLGNQPRMRAAEGSASDRVEFECVDCTGGGNIAAKETGHMHQGTFVFRDADHIHTEWRKFEAGVNDYTASFELARQE